MPRVSTKVDLCRGHDACMQRPFSTHSPTVTAETFPVTREGDSFEEHGCGQHPPHSAVVRYGWQTVRANGKPIAFVGAPITCPSAAVGTGRTSVMVGEGARVSLG